MYKRQFLVRSYKNRLKEAIAGDDTMNFNYFEGKGLDLREIISLADTMPFFSDRRLILVEDSGCFKTSSEELAEYLPQMPDTTCMIFVESAVDKRNRLYKKVKELGYAAEFSRQDAGQLARWAGGILAQNGRKIRSSTMELFLEKTGDDMENIRMELEKLICYTMGREEITAQDVEEICTVQVTKDVYKRQGDGRGHAGGAGGGGSSLRHQRPDWRQHQRGVSVLPGGEKFRRLHCGDRK